jgi:hypothetical protein
MIRMEENRDARAGNVWLWPVMARSKWHSKLEGLCCFWQLPNYKTLHKPHPNGKKMSTGCFNTALSSLLEYDKRLWRPKKTFISLQKETTSFSGPCVQFFRCCYRFKPVISLLVPYPWHKNCIPWLLSSRRGLLSGSGGLSGATPSTGWLQKTSSWLLGMYTIVYPHKMSL